MPAASPPPEKALESEVFASLKIHSEGGGRAESLKAGGRLLMPVWQVKLIRAAVFGLGHVAVLGGVLYWTGYWKRFVTRHDEPAPAIASEPKAAPPPASRPPEPKALALAPAPKSKAAAPATKPAPKRGPVAPRRDAPREDDAAGRVGEADPVENPEDDAGQKTIQGAPPADQGRPTDRTLRGLDLKRVGVLLIHDGEESVFMRLNDVRKAVVDYDGASEVLAGFVGHVNEINTSQAGIDERREAIQGHKPMVDHANFMSNKRDNNSMIQEWSPGARGDQCPQRGDPDPGRSHGVPEE